MFDEEKHFFLRFPFRAFFIIKNSEWLGTKCLIFYSNFIQSAHQKLPQGTREIKEMQMNRMMLPPCLYHAWREDRETFSLGHKCSCVVLRVLTGEVGRVLEHLHLPKSQLWPELLSSRIQEPWGMTMKNWVTINPEKLDLPCFSCTFFLRTPALYILSRLL